MTNRLGKRGLRSLIIYYLIITAVSAPLAFFAGRAQSAPERAAAPHIPSQIEADVSKPDYAALYKARRQGIECGGAGDPSIMRSAVWEIICHPASSGIDFARVERRPTARRPIANDRRGERPLRQAVLSALSSGAASNESGPGNGDGATVTGQPIGLALSPEFTPFGGGGNESGNLGLSGGPNAPGGRPNNIIPGTPPTNATFDPPVVVTPVPAALPMLVSGLIGLWAAARRKKRL